MTSEYLTPTILDSRRLFGPNLYSTRPGAVLDVQYDSAATRQAAEQWPAQARRLADALGWRTDVCSTHPSIAMASLFIAAPVDGLLTATDLTEHAWVAAESIVTPGGVPEAITAHAVAILRDKYARERSVMPGVVAIEQDAYARHVSFSLDDSGCSVGSGAGVHLYAFSDAPDDADDDLEGDVGDDTPPAFDVPVALVTGSNGKTTTTRLVAAMWRAAGRRTGWSCSDGVWVDDDRLESGDYTGPSGARRVLCDTRVEAAVLETARGGMLRRGLATTLVQGAIITNISADHFGEYGVETLDHLANAKAIVARALRPASVLVLNADDPTLRALAIKLAATLHVAVAWFSVTDHPFIAESVAQGSPASTVRDGQLLVHHAGAWHALGDVNAMPVTIGGTASHNIANATGAALLAATMGVPIDAIRATLASFGTRRDDNPGRLMVSRLGRLTVVIDYAHNPDGIAALIRTVAAIPATRRLLLIGQAGNRDDVQLRALATSAWATQRFDRIIIKEMVGLLRGRPVGEIPLLLRSAFIAAGAPAEIIDDATSEIDAVRDALTWARAGDVLVLGVHFDRASVLALVDQLADSGWGPGDALPPTTISP